MYNNQVLVAWLVEYLMLRNFGPYAVFTISNFPFIFDGQFTSKKMLGILRFQMQAEGKQFMYTIYCGNNF
jgi:hypothetical protein